MRVLLMGRSLILVRGLREELTDHGIAIVGHVRTVSELGASLAAAPADTVLACLLGAEPEVRSGALAITSVLAEHPGTAALALTAVPMPSPWPASHPGWVAMPLESADTASLLIALNQLIAAPPCHSARSQARLTSGEQRVLDLLAVGLSNDAIAHRLGVSLKTVETHISRAFDKLGLLNDDHTRNRRVLAALLWAGL